MGRKVWQTYETDTNSKQTGAKFKYGYARVSTPTQNVRRQIDDIHSICPEAIIYYETYTGTKSDRPEWQKLLHLARLGQVSEIWFCDVSRMARNKEEGYQTYMELYHLGIELHFILTPQIDTTTYKETLNRIICTDYQLNDSAVNEFVNEIFAALNDYMSKIAQRQIYIAFAEAENEAKQLSQRTKEGLEVARIKGSQIGRQKGITIDTRKRRKAIRKILTYWEKYDGPKNVVKAEDCIKMCGISKSSFYRYVDERNKMSDKERRKYTYTPKRKG